MKNGKSQNEITAIAISGGIDSLMAAHRLKEEGHSLIGLHFLTGYEHTTPKQIRAVAAQLDMPVHIIDCSHIFQTQVVDYFVRTYFEGMTPNPCLVCNPLIKFTALWEKAADLGATKLATGHYARAGKGANGRMRLLKGVDPEKDQSYFLAFLTQEQLKRALFPIGDMTKEKIRKKARKLGLKAADIESQDVCFIRETSCGEFLTRQAPVENRPGPIVDTKGNLIGEHQGLHLFTRGQRRGINCPATEPYYVIQMDRDSNRLIVGTRDDLLSRSCTVEGINWIIPPPKKEPIEASVRVRYRTEGACAQIILQQKEKALITFDTPQMAVTPGQGAVFYDGDLVLGAGWIRTV